MAYNPNSKHIEFAAQVQTKTVSCLAEELLGCHNNDRAFTVEINGINVDAVVKNIEYIREFLIATLTIKSTLLRE